VIDELVTGFVLILARVGSFITVVPILGGPNVPRTVKIGFSLALTVLFMGDGNGALPVVEGGTLGGLTSWFGLSLALGREMILGGMLGFAMSLLLLPAHVAAEFITQEAGLSIANTLTATGDTGTPLASLFEIMATLIFFSLDLHHIFLLVLQETFTMTPIGQGFHLPNWDLIMAAGAAEESGLLLAGPVILCLFLATIVIIVMARVAPQLNLYSFGLPLRVLVCLTSLLLLLPTIVSSMVGQFANLLGLLQLHR
jgi:flagellar biosynthesis protein FliR